MDGIIFFKVTRRSRYLEGILDPSRGLYVFFVGTEEVGMCKEVLFLG